MKNILKPCQEAMTISSEHTPFVMLVSASTFWQDHNHRQTRETPYNPRAKKSMLAAGDTFRAAAVEQLMVWGERNKFPSSVSNPALIRRRSSLMRCNLPRHAA